MNICQYSDHRNPRPIGPSVYLTTGAAAGSSACNSAVVSTRYRGGGGQCPMTIPAKTTGDKRRKQPRPSSSSSSSRCRPPLLFFLLLLLLLLLVHPLLPSYGERHSSAPVDPFVDAEQCGYHRIVRPRSLQSRSSHGENKSKSENRKIVKK